MAITPAQIRDEVTGYLDAHPQEKPELALLLDLLDAGAELTSRAEFRGHATVNAVLLNPARQVLLIRHLALRRWITPGGHLEPQDATLLDAARRELTEETGVAAGEVVPVGDRTIHVDIHPIPASAAKGEPAHQHIDFRYLFTTTAAIGQLQAQEVTDAAWRDLDAIDSPRLRDRVTAAIPAGRPGHIQSA